MWAARSSQIRRSARVKADPPTSCCRLGPPSRWMTPCGTAPGCATLGTRMNRWDNPLGLLLATAVEDPSVRVALRWRSISSWAGVGVAGVAGVVGGAIVASDWSIGTERPPPAAIATLSS
eukprot:scaffold41165_cov32-Prasinocladus_malaysianus.AAC.2